MGPEPWFHKQDLDVLVKPFTTSPGSSRECKSDQLTLSLLITMLAEHS